MNASQRQQLLTIAAIAAVVLLVGDRLLLTPLTRAWTDRAARIVQLKKSVRQGTLLLEREQVIRERWAGFRAHVLSNEVSSAETQVYTALDHSSQGSRIGVSSIRPQWKRTEDDYATLECRIDAFGGLPAVSRFLYEIEKDPLGLKLETVEITARDNRGEQLTLALQVSGLQLHPPATP